MDKPEYEPGNLPRSVCLALDRDELKPEHLLFMCGVSNDELLDHLAEFDDRASQEVVELSAYRLAEVLDTLTEQISENAIQDLGREYLNTLAELVVSQVVVEERAVVRHLDKAPDHNCQDENCPYFQAQIRYSFEFEPGVPLSELPKTLTPQTLMDFGSEWE